MKSVDITNMSVLELKALAYDLVVERTDALRRADDIANSLRIIDQQIAAKSSTAPPPSPTPPAQES